MSRRLILVGLVAIAALPACSSSDSSAPPKPSPSTAPSPPGNLPPPPTDRLEVGKPVDREIKDGELHRFRVDIPAGNTAVGVVMQNGIDVALTVLDPTGNKLAELDSPNGGNGPEPFAIEATTAGAYVIEVKPFIEPPRPGSGSGSGSGSAAVPPPATPGRYEARLDQLLTADAVAEREASLRISSPKILEVWRAVRAHRTADVDKFWADLKGKAPIVEPYPGDAKDVLVTFVIRATTPYVGMLGGPDFREKPLVRVGDSDIWYLTARMPADSRFEYAFIVADGPPEFSSPFTPDRGPGPRWNMKQTDPNNPIHSEMSSAVLPGAAPQPWIEVKPDVAKGAVKELTIESAQMKESRRVGVYTPAGYDPKRRYPLVIAYDGERYGLEPNPTMPLPTILDNLIAAKEIPPVVAVFVANQGTRDRDLTGSPEFAAFVAKELVPRMRADYRAGMTPAETTVTGSSHGGLCSAYTAFRHSDVIGNVLSQSGSFPFIRGSIGVDTSPWVEGGWLIRDYAASPKLPIRFYLDAGLFEDRLRDSNRHMRDVLVAKGYSVKYVEFSGGHDEAMWRHTIAEGLRTLLPAP